MRRLLNWLLYGEWTPLKPGEMRCQRTQRIVPLGWRYCDTCDKHISPDVRCNYDWGGNCTAADYSWIRDGTIRPVRSGKGTLEAELAHIVKTLGSLDKPPAQP